jgi:hypothetical protein
MTIPQKPRFALLKNADPVGPENGVLVVEERDLWQLVGDMTTRTPDIGTVRYAMGTVYETAQAVLEGKPPAKLIRRLEALPELSDDEGFRRLMDAVLHGVRSGRRDGVLAAQLTSLCAMLMMSGNQTLWPRNWHDPKYRRPAVWRPGSSGFPETGALATAG